MQDTRYSRFFGTIEFDKRINFKLDRLRLAKFVFNLQAIAASHFCKLQCEAYFLSVCLSVCLVQNVARIKQDEPVLIKKSDHLSSFVWYRPSSLARICSTQFCLLNFTCDVIIMITYWQHTSNTQAAGTS